MKTKSIASALLFLLVAVALSACGQRRDSGYGGAGAAGELPRAEIVGTNGYPVMDPPPPGGGDGFAGPGEGPRPMTGPGGRPVADPRQRVQRTTPPKFDGFVAVTTTFKVVDGKKVITGRKVAQVGKDDPGLLKEGNTVHQDRRIHFHNGQVVSGGEIFQDDELDQIMAKRRALGLDGGTGSGPPTRPRK